jgi:hypothetical protein
MDDLFLRPSDCSPSDLLQTLGPYLGNCMRRRFPDGLRLSVDRGRDFLSILVGGACEGDLTEKDWFVTVAGPMRVTLGGGEAGKSCPDIVAHLPQEKVVDLITALPILRSEGLCTQMYNLTRLHLKCVDLST